MAERLRAGQRSGGTEIRAFAVKPEPAIAGFRLGRGKPFHYLRTQISPASVGTTIEQHLGIYGQVAPVRKQAGMPGYTVHIVGSFIVNSRLNGILPEHRINLSGRNPARNPARSDRWIKVGGIHSQCVIKFFAYVLVDPPTGDFLNNFCQQNKSEVAVLVFCTRLVN